MLRFGNTKGFASSWIYMSIMNAAMVNFAFLSMAWSTENSCPHSLFETNIALSTWRLSGRQHWLVLDRLEMRSQRTQIHRRHPAPTAIKTQPLSNHVLRACSYQSARQRKMGVAKKKCQGFWRLVGKGRWFGRPFFQTNPQELSTLCLYPEPLNNTKNVSIKKHCLSQLLPTAFNPATFEEHPINNHGLDRVLFWKACNGKKCINSYTGLEVGWYWRASSWASSETYTWYKIIYSWTVAGMQTGAVLSKLPHPNNFGLGFSRTLQEARLESLMRERSRLTTRQKESKRDCNRPTAVWFWGN